MTDDVSELVEAVHKASETGGPVGDVCAGCLELSERVERLEKVIQQFDDLSSEPYMTTRTCYCVCLLVHAFVVFACACSEYTITALYGLLLGSAATLSVCHVLAQRTFLKKTVRSLFSANVVMFAGTCGVTLMGMDGYETLIPLALITVPSSFVAGWLAAKIYVWSAGWSIALPQKTLSPNKLQIRDLLILTFVIAAYLGLIRVNVFGVAGFDSEYFGYIVYTAIPVFICAMFTVPVARTVLTPNRRVRLRALACVLAGSGTFVSVGYLGLYVISGESVDLSTAIMVTLMCFVSMILVFASPIFTFFMMRQANYRFEKLRRRAGAPSVEKSTIVAEPAA